MRETTAEIWIGPAQSSDLMGTQGGINPTHLLLLRENSRPAWMMIPGDWHSSRPPVVGRPSVWIPTAKCPTQDALLMFAVQGSQTPEIKAVFGEFVKSRQRKRLDLDELFGERPPRELYAACQKHLKDWHVLVSVGSYSLARRDLSALKRFQGLDIEIRETTGIHRHG